MKIKVLVISLIIGILFASIYNDYQLNSRFKFSENNIHHINLFEGNHGLVYDFEINEKTLNTISQELIKSRKIKKPANRYPRYISLFIAFENNSYLSIIENNDKSVQVISKKNSSIKKLLVESKYLVDYLNELKKKYSVNEYNNKS